MEAINYFAPISVFQILVRIFKNTQFHLSRSSSVCKHFSYFVLKHIMEAKKLGFTGIQRILFSDQWFLDFGEDAREYLISLITTQFCLENLLIICLTTYSGSEITLFHWEPSSILLRSVCSGFWWGFQEYLIHLTRRSFVCKSFSDFVLPHVMEAKKLCFNWIQVLFCSDQCFLDFGKDIREHLIWLIWTQFCSYQLLILCFTTYLGGENTKGAINYFAPINVFRILVRIFLNTWFHLFRRSYVCKSCSDLVWPLNVEAKTLCFVGIQYLLSSD